ncbi:hypothetical protein EV178_002000 [Coemansia sp. RSA 1646]|nr:hypothetical protein EV178_002000 [Coemansia sp. RSA 1646]
MELHVRANYDQTGQYLYSEDLCVGVFDGTDFNSGTCERSNLTSSDTKYPTSSMIIRYNMVEPNIGYIAGVMGNLTSETSAQCVMTNTTSTACWIWDNGFNECFERYYYDNAEFVGADNCHRTRVVEGSYAMYVSRSDGAVSSTDADASQSSSAAVSALIHPRGKTMSELVTLKAVAMAGMILTERNE